MHAPVAKVMEGAMSTALASGRLVFAVALAAGAALSTAFGVAFSFIQARHRQNMARMSVR